MSSLLSVPVPVDFVASQAAIELHPADGRQVVTFVGKEQVFEQVFGRFFGRRLARTHHPVDFDQRFHWLVVTSRRIALDMYGPLSRSLTNSVSTSAIRRSQSSVRCRSIGHFVVDVCQQFTGRLIDDIVSPESCRPDSLSALRSWSHRPFQHLADMLGGDPTAFFDDHLVFVLDVECRDFAAHPLGDRSGTALDRH